MEGQKKRKYTHYRRQFKLDVASEIVSGMKGTSEAARDHGIDRGVVESWVKKFRSEILERKSMEIVPSLTMKPSKNKNQQIDLQRQVQSLEIENLKLRQKLIESDLKTEALSTLIELAEESYGISLRKNSGAKQSKE